MNIQRGILYIVEIEDWKIVKIGITGNISARLGGLQSWARAQFGRDIKVLGVKPGTRKTEQRIHRQLQHRLVGRLPMTDRYRLELFHKTAEIDALARTFKPIKWSPSTRHSPAVERRRRPEYWLRRWALANGIEAQQTNGNR